MIGLNTVKLRGIYGDDETIACSAWVIMPDELTPERRSRIPRFLKDTLVGLSDPAHGPPHTSPFEKGIIHFLVTTDIATHIHILKHRIGVSTNAESARYKELREDRAYVPVDWPFPLQSRLVDDIDLAQKKYHEYIEELVASGFSRQRAKESARYILPYATQISADIVFHFNTFMHFQTLRNDTHAQLEVREIAKEMLEIVRDTGKFPASLAAYGY
ncbi:MAG: FAD-dependent thymidylate synthase [Nitrospirales bacterium]